MRTKVKTEMKRIKLELYEARTMRYDQHKGTAKMYARQAFNMFKCDEVDFLVLVASGAKNV